MFYPFPSILLWWNTEEWSEHLRNTYDGTTERMQKAGFLIMRLILSPVKVAERPTFGKELLVWFNNRVFSLYNMFVCTFSFRLFVCVEA